MQSAQVPNVTYMNIPFARGDKEQSFEELRVEDYLKAYTTTGRPPIPCPPLPTDEQERAALGLPPLFVPYMESSLSDTGTPEAPAANHNDIPDIQIFRPASTPLGESMQSIVCQGALSRYSFEELRYHAYSHGRKFVREVLPTLPTNGTASVPLSPSAAAGPSQQELFGVAGNPAYSKHSFEELRLAYVRLRRELTSDEIIRSNSVLKLTV